MSALSACSALDPKAAAQHNYDQALADYQNCINDKPPDYPDHARTVQSTLSRSNVVACAKQREAYEASAKLLTVTLTSGQ
jgi:hypothetical protein